MKKQKNFGKTTEEAKIRASLKLKLQKLGVPRSVTYDMTTNELKIKLNSIQMKKKTAPKKKATAKQLAAQKKFAVNAKKAGALVKSGKAKTMKSAWKQIKK